jgi:hypothetical protein
MMRDVHTIRLRGRWQAESIGESIVYRRSFHQPTGLEDGEQVVLAVSMPSSSVRVALNGQLLGNVVESPQRFDVTDSLQPFNLLEINVKQPQVDALSPSAHDKDLQREVWLEIGFGV